MTLFFCFFFRIFSSLSFLFFAPGDGGMAKLARFKPEKYLVFLSILMEVLLRRIMPCSSVRGELVLLQISSILRWIMEDRDYFDKFWFPTSFSSLNEEIILLAFMIYSLLTGDCFLLPKDFVGELLMVGIESKSYEEVMLETEIDSLNLEF